MTWPARGIADLPPRKKPRGTEPATTDERLPSDGDPCFLAPSCEALLAAWHFGQGRMKPDSVIGVGIDPGRHGALGLVLRTAGVVRGASVFPLPVIADPTKQGRSNRKTIDGPTLWRWLRLLGGEATGNAVVRIAMEKHQHIPGKRGAEHHEQGEGSSAGFEYANTRSALIAGRLRGLLDALAVERNVIVLVEPSPGPWRAAIGLAGGGDKEYLRERARAAYPQLQPRLSAKAHHNRAEALLLATYALDAPC